MQKGLCKVLNGAGNFFGGPAADFLVDLFPLNMKFFDLNNF